MLIILSSPSQSLYLLIKLLLSTQYLRVSYVSPSVMSESSRPHGPESARLLCPWDSLGKNVGVDCHSLLQPEYLCPPKGLP